MVDEESIPAAGRAVKQGDVKVTKLAAEGRAWRRRHQACLRRL